MDKISNFGRSEAELVRQTVEKAVKAALSDMGVSVTKCSARFASTDMSVSLNLQIADLPIEKTPNGKDYIMFADSYGLSADWLGKTFLSKNGASMTRFKVMGLSTRRPKMPIDCRNLENGKLYKFPADLVKKGFNAEGRTHGT